LPHDSIYWIGNLISLRSADNNSVHAIDQIRGTSVFLPQNTAGLIIDIIHFKSENLVLYVILVKDKQLLLPEQYIFEFKV
jgi:hypothetical protein